MAILSADDYWAAAKQLIPFTKTNSGTSVAAQWHTLFDRAGNPGAGALAIGNTANGLVPTDATTGFPLINAFGGGATGYLTNVDFGCSIACRLALYDRLFHAGSYAFTPATTNLTAQPSFVGRLPGSDYKGLQLWVEINTTWTAATASSVTVTYTNENGVAGRTTGAYVLPTAVVTGRMFQLPLQAGDNGIQQINSVQLANSTGTPAAGSLNVIVARPLWTGRVRIANDGDAHDPFKTGAPIVFDTSAIMAMTAPDSTSTGIPDLMLEIANK